jgi:xylulokinase
LPVFGITPNTGKIDLVSSALEGVGYSLRQGIEMIEKDMSKVTIIGGGGRVIEWNKIIADILAHPVEVYDDSEFIAGIALASLVFLDLNIIIDIKDFVSKVSKVRHVEPNMDNNYDELYKRYIQLYPKLKGI